MFQHLQNVLPRISFSFSLSGLAYFQHLSICFKKMFFTMFQEGKYSMCLCVFFRNYQKVWHKISNNLYLITEWVSLWHMREWKCSTLKLKKNYFLPFLFFLFSQWFLKSFVFLHLCSTAPHYCTSSNIFLEVRWNLSLLCLHPYFYVIHYFGYI